MESEKKIIQKLNIDTIKEKDHHSQKLKLKIIRNFFLQYFVSTMNEIL